jgi:DNA-directed RNA polymerase specialized sigma24 family protein
MTEQYQPLLRWLAHRCGLSAEDVEDAVQFTWLRCLEHIDQLTDADMLKRLAGGHLPSRVRSAGPRGAARGAAQRTGHGTADRRQGSERDLCTETALRDRHERLYHAILALPARQRVVLVELLKRGSQSYLDFSGRLGLPMAASGPSGSARSPGCASIPGQPTCRRSLRRSSPGPELVTLCGAGIEPVSPDIVSRRRAGHGKTLLRPQEIGPGRPPGQNLNIAGKAAARRGLAAALTIGFHPRAIDWK